MPTAMFLGCLSRNLWRRTGAFRRVGFIDDSPLRETRTAFFGGRGAKAQMVRGERSQGRPARRGSRSAQARHERGRSGRGPRRSPGLILDGAGVLPRFSHERARGGDSRPQDRSRAQPGSTRSPGWRRARMLTLRLLWARSCDLSATLPRLEAEGCFLAFHLPSGTSAPPTSVTTT